MGKNYQGINGNWSGKIGPTVGRQKDGRTITAIYQPVVSNPKTAKQENNRAKFSLISETFRGMAGWAKIVDKGLTKYGTGWSNLLKINMDYVNTISGTPGAYEVLIDALELSRGGVPMGASLDAEIDGGALVAGWTDNTDGNVALADDICCLAAYNSVKKQWIFQIDIAKRNERTASLVLPSLWSGDGVDCWASFGRYDRSEFGASLYLGNFTA